MRDVPVHDVRHTAGTLLVAQGVHIRAVQEILGHSDVRTAEGYTHVASEIARDAAARMGRALGGPTMPEAAILRAPWTLTRPYDAKDSRLSRQPGEPFTAARHR